MHRWIRDTERGFVHVIQFGEPRSCRREEFPACSTLPVRIGWPPHIRLPDRKVHDQPSAPSSQARRMAANEGWVESSPTDGPSRFIFPNGDF